MPTRDPERYRGPSPLLVFGVYFFAMSLVGLVLLSLLDVDPERPFNFLAIGVVQAAGYLLVVWLFAVRTDALTWPQMGWPTWGGSGAGEVARSAGTAVLVMLPVTFALLIVGGIVGLLLGTDAPQVLPLSETFLDGVFVVLAAAILIPIGEEVFFRGFAQTAWTRDLGTRDGAAAQHGLLRGRAHRQHRRTHVRPGPGPGDPDARGHPAGGLRAGLALRAVRPGGGDQRPHLVQLVLLVLAFLASKIPEPAGL